MIKKILYTVSIILGVLFGGVVLYKGKFMSASQKGKPPKGSDEFKTESDDVISVKSGDSWKSVKLPKGVKAEDVRSVKYEDGSKKSTVEVIHNQKNRRGNSPVDNSAHSRLHG